MIERFCLETGYMYKLNPRATTHEDKWDIVIMPRTRIRGVHRVCIDGACMNAGKAADGNTYAGTNWTIECVEVVNGRACIPG